jgi:hypothetical protein
MRQKTTDPTMTSGDRCAICGQRTEPGALVCGDCADKPAPELSAMWCYGGEAAHEKGAPSELP